MPISPLSHFLLTGASYTCCSPHPSNLCAPGLPMSGETLARALLQAHPYCSTPDRLRQVTSGRWQELGSLGNPALSPVLSYSKKHLYKGVPRRVTQALVSPSETQLKKCWGQLPWGQFPELADPHPCDSLARTGGSQVPVTCV